MMVKFKKHPVVFIFATIALFVLVYFTAPVFTGDLDPGGTPDSTMKTLDQIPPTWSQKLDASDRFELVLDGEAVLDKETGLVWEKSPDINSRNWYDACTHCYRRDVGNRRGWRLPTIEELASLVEFPLQFYLSLPSGHPFNNVQSSHYWSSTTYASSTSSAWRVYFRYGDVNFNGKSNDHYVWCVRGGHGHDGY